MTPLALLFDRCFPRPIARMLERYEQGKLLVRFQDDDERFTETMSDVDIIRTLSADATYRWVLISADRRMTRRPLEWAALQGSRIKFFYFGKAWFKLDLHEQAWRFVRSWPALVRIAETHENRIFEIEGVNLKFTPSG